MLKISIDLDGTFFEHPAYLSAMAKGLQKAGHKVGVLTGRFDSTKPMDRKRVKALGFEPDFFVNRSDSLDGKSPIPWKARKIRSESIDVHYDDEALKILRFMGRDRDKLVIHVPYDKPNERHS